VGLEVQLSTCSKLGFAGAGSRRFVLGARCGGHALSHNMCAELEFGRPGTLMDPENPQTPAQHIR